MASNNESNGNKHFVPLITIEEYEQQKAEYTQKALRELQKHMKSIDHNKLSRTSSDSSEDNTTNKFNTTLNNNTSDSISDDNANNTDEDINDVPKVNVIINHYKNKNKQSETQCGIRKRKIAKNDNEDTLTSVIYAQREIESQELEKYKNITRRLENNLSEEERKNHFLKLDLNNANVDNNNLRIQITKLTNDNTKLKNTVYNDWVMISLLKILIVLLIIGQFIIIYYQS